MEPGLPIILRRHCNIIFTIKLSNNKPKPLGSKRNNATPESQLKKNAAARINTGLQRFNSLFTLKYPLPLPAASTSHYAQMVHIHLSKWYTPGNSPSHHYNVL